MCVIAIFLLHHLGHENSQNRSTCPAHQVEYSKNKKKTLQNSNRPLVLHLKPLVVRVTR